MSTSNEVSGIKIFEMNDCDWVAAKDVDSAIAEYEPLMRQEDTTPIELTSEQLDKLVYYINGDDDTISFREQLEKLVASGQSFPMIFATTEY